MQICCILKKIYIKETALERKSDELLSAPDGFAEKEDFTEREDLPKGRLSCKGNKKAGPKAGYHQ